MTLLCPPPLVPRTSSLGGFVHVEGLPRRVAPVVGLATFDSRLLPAADLGVVVLLAHDHAGVPADGQATGFLHGVVTVVARRRRTTPGSRRAGATPTSRSPR